MYLQKILLATSLSLSLIQINGCPSKKNVMADVNVTPQTTPPKKVGKEQKGDKEKMDLLLQKVLNKEPSAVNLAKEIGSSATPRLKPLATNSDSGVRLIALDCLYYTGGEGVAEIFINGLTDESPTTSAAAANGLRNHLNSGIYPELLEVYNKVEDPQRRNDIALMLGKIESAKVGDLKEKYEKESDALAKEGLTAALGKLGDGDSKTEFLKNLQSVKERDLKRYFDYVEYINQPWATRGLSPILNDKSDLLRIGVDAMPGFVPEYLRACDLALNLIVKLTRAKLSFNVDGKTNYSDAQLQEAGQFLTTLR